VRGHIIKRYKNSYTIVLNLGIDPITGKRKQQWVSVKGTKKDAEKRLAELLHQLDTGTFMKPCKTTVGEFLERWLKEYVWPNLSPRTAEGYQYIVHKHLTPSFGNMLLVQLKPEHLQRYYSEKLQRGRCDGNGGLSSCSIRHHHMALHMALATAVRWGLLTRNAADAVSPPRIQHRDMHICDEDDIRRFLEAAKATPYYAIYYLAFFTGMRRSEILALRWSDVDLTLGQIYVCRSLHHLRNRQIVFREPKTSRGRRTIALPPSATLMLREHRDRQDSERLLLGILQSNNELVFCQPDGKPLLPNPITHAWVKLARRLGMHGLRLHDARHTHASLMLKQGIHPKIVQERLGHSSVQITLDTYSHVAPGLQGAAATRFDEFLASKLKSEPSVKVG
jgi:integrase